MATAKQIAKRQAYVEKIIGFVHQLLTTKGKTLKHEEHSCHYYALRELKLDGFTFTDEGAFTMFGGEEVTIHYNGFKVFWVKYHNIKECEVLEFDTSMPCPDWQTPLKKLMRTGVARIAKRIEGSEKKLVTKNQNAMQQVRAQMDLEAEAHRLRL